MTTSFKSLKLDIRRRYDLTVLVIIVVVSLLLIGTLYRVVAGYANDYSIRYWMQHTQTFTESLRYPVIMSSASGADNLVRTFATDRNVMHTSVFNGLGLLASSGHAPECQRTQSEIKDSFVVETNDIWCIFAPSLRVPSLSDMLNWLYPRPIITTFCRKYCPLPRLLSQLLPV